MNKKLIALAVAAGLVAPMAANAAPTVYGKLQAEIFSSSSDFVTNGSSIFHGADNHVIRNKLNSRVGDGMSMVDSKRGRLGVKGSEDLGGGLSGIYKFEWQVDTTEANVNNGTRESWVGLKGDWGVLQAGSVKSPYKYFGGVKYDPFVTTRAEGRRYGGMTRGQYGSNSFWDKSLSYQNKSGPGHFWAVLGVAEADSLQVDKIDDGDYAVGYKFNTGGWEAFVAAAHDEDNSSADNGYDALKIGGAMSFGPSKLMAQLENTTDETANGDNDGQVLWVNYNFKMGKNTFTAAYGTGSVDLASSSTDQENDMIRIGVVHKFTKKSRMFAGWASRSYDNLNGSTAAAATGDQDVLTAGIRHDF